MQNSHVILIIVTATHCLVCGWHMQQHCGLVCAAGALSHEKSHAVNLIGAPEIRTATSSSPRNRSQHTSLVPRPNPHPLPHVGVGSGIETRSTPDPLRGGGSLPRVGVGSGIETRSTPDPLRGGSTGSRGHNLKITCLHIHEWWSVFRYCTPLLLIPNGGICARYKVCSDSNRCTLSHWLHDLPNARPL